MKRTRLRRRTTLARSGRARRLSGAGGPSRTPFRVPDKNLDDLCREVVFLRDRYRCARCNKSSTEAVFAREIEFAGLRVLVYRYPGFHWSHVYRRWRASMKWNPLNALMLCGPCHAWWHKHETIPDEHGELAGTWFAKRFPDRARDLTLIAGTSHKIDRMGILIDLMQQAQP